AYKEYHACAMGEAAPKPKASARKKKGYSTSSTTPPTPTPTTTAESALYGCLLLLKENNLQEQQLLLN
nr:hypothetical protein [Tanacetum cinerariifolium]